MRALKPSLLAPSFDLVLNAGQPIDQQACNLSQLFTSLIHGKSKSAIEIQSFQSPYSVIIQLIDGLTVRQSDSARV